MSSFNEETLKELDEFIDEYIGKMEERYKGNQAAMDKIKHIRNVVKLTEIITNGDRMSMIAAKFHDIRKVCTARNTRKF